MLGINSNFGVWQCINTLSDPIFANLADFAHSICLTKTLQPRQDDMYCARNFSGEQSTIQAQLQILSSNRLFWGGQTTLFHCNRVYFWSSNENIELAFSANSDDFGMMRKQKDKLVYSLSLSLLTPHTFTQTPVKAFIAWKKISIGMR